MAGAARPLRLTKSAFAGYWLLILRACQEFGESNRIIYLRSAGRNAGLHKQAGVFILKKIPTPTIMEFGKQAARNIRCTHNTDSRQFPTALPRSVPLDQG